MGRILANLAVSRDALRVTIADPSLRRLLLAWTASWTAKQTFLITNLIVAYGSGGPAAVGLIGVATFLPSALLAPFTGIPAARWRPERVLLVATAIRGLAAAGAAVVAIAGGGIGPLAVMIAIEAAASSVNWPLHTALLPCLARTPQQLVAANVTSSAIDGIGAALGPAIAGVLVVLVGAGPTDALVAILFALAVLALAGIRAPRVARPDTSVRAAAHQLSAGLRAVATEAGPRLVTIGASAQTLVRGLLTVLLVVAAIESLGMGDQGVGTLTAAIGVGALIGAVLAITLTGRPRQGPFFLASLVGWGAPILVVGLVLQPLVAIVAMLVVGVSNSFLDITASTLLQRTARNETRVAVLGAFEGSIYATAAIGGAVAPLLIDGVGVETGLLVTGAILPVVALLLWRPLGRVDEGGPELAARAVLLRRVPLLEPLSLAALEHLARDVEPVRYAAGDWLMREGETGTEFVVIESGEAEVRRGGAVVRVEGPGSGIGEIALLRDVPRTASVMARTDVTAYRIGRAAFLDAVTGHPASEDVASATIDERLRADSAPA